MLTIKIKGDGLKQIEQALEALSDEQGKRAIARAMNEVGKTMRGKVIRATAKQVGASQAIVKKRGRITSKPATAGSLSYVISSQGGHMLLKDFGAKQNRKGVRAKPWGQGRTFGGAFMGARPGLSTRKLGGNVFHRTGKERLPIQNMYGPAVPVEMVKGEAEATFRDYGEQRLPKRILHHITQTTKGTFS
ncbi:phage tail protein [Antarcticirhabdus aurantiaca]|uniref:Phage tail protein n=1 Tax=Antarcticirhabdus aurantiaca TaxID=2606717 RepID=A0ACD4NV52_9HYPH|nr:phage tail protein [Antarcticirhabdus aurantiaca]WAJ30620.1 phage tail protein [Jeongeuplla avenae]